MGFRRALAQRAGDLATWASQKTGRGSGGMIGGLVARLIYPNILTELGHNRPVIIVTGTNGKSTTTRMLAAAVRTRYSVATNDRGDNMEEGIVSALFAHPEAEAIVIECDELHVPNVAEQLNATALVVLNLSRDQLDRVGEINKIEHTLRQCVNARPQMTVIANCDDVNVASVAFDHENTIWVAAGAGWTHDSVSSPRGEGRIVRDEATGDWWEEDVDGARPGFRRPEPTYSVQPAADSQDTDTVVTPEGEHPLHLQLPGRANLGNAAQAVAGAVSLGVPVADAVAACESVTEVAGRYATVHLGDHDIHLLLAKNPGGWQEALSMVDRTADGVVIAVNGQVADGVDLSWLWDVVFEDFEGIPVVAAGERGADLAVRLLYADVDHTLVKDPVAAIKSCPPGRIEVLANYTAFRDLKRDLARATANGTTEEARHA